MKEKRSKTGVNRATRADRTAKRGTGQVALSASTPILSRARIDIGTPATRALQRDSPCARRQGLRGAKRRESENNGFFSDVAYTRDTTILTGISYYFFLFQFFFTIFFLRLFYVVSFALAGAVSTCRRVAMRAKR